MKRICVFCGSSPGARSEYLQAAAGLGRALAENHIGLIYGGGNVGMMGQVARAVLEREGAVTGVIPRALVDREVALTDLADLRVVDSMHQRKSLMADLADAFIAMPGGLGTLEEFVEVLTWLQLGIHEKPCGLLNVCGYFDRFIDFLGHIAREQFVQAEFLDLVLTSADPQALIEQLDRFRLPPIDKAAWALKMNNC